MVKMTMATSITLLFCLLLSLQAFRLPYFISKTARNRCKFLYAASGDPSDEKTLSSKVKSLTALALNLRAEAASLEAALNEEKLKSVEEAFSRFDTDKDGSISVEELREGLSKAMGSSITEEQSKKLIQIFDDSGDGNLQMDEFKGIDALRSKLDALIREEMDIAQKNAKAAREAAEAAEEASRAAAALQMFLNEKPPSLADRVFSIVPYALPFIDSLQYGNYIMNGHEDSPFVKTALVLYTYYTQAPFSGLIAYIALNILSNNLQLNRIIRFNMQQAIYIDIALIIPGIIAGAAGYLLPSLPVEVVSLSSTLTFGTIFAVIAYSCLSSLLGFTPDVIPIISENAEKRVPASSMFDQTTGRFLSRQERKEREAAQKNNADKDC